MAENTLSHNHALCCPDFDADALGVVGFIPEMPCRAHGHRLVYAVALQFDAFPGQERDWQSDATVCVDFAHSGGDFVMSDEFEGFDCSIVWASLAAELEAAL